MRLRRAATDQPHALLLSRRFALPDKNQALNLPVASCLVTRAPIGSVKEDGSRAFVIRPYTPISAETTGHLDLVGCWRGGGDVDGGGGGKRGLIGWHDSGAAGRRQPVPVLCGTQCRERNGWPQKFACSKAICSNQQRVNNAPV